MTVPTLLLGALSSGLFRGDAVVVLAHFDANPQEVMVSLGRLPFGKLVATGRGRC